MKLIARRVVILVLTGIFLICFPVLINAQSVDCPDLPDPDVPCPIDSWVFVLLIAGIIYGMVKAKVFQKPARLNK